MPFCHLYLRCRKRSSTERVDGGSSAREHRMVTTTKAARIIEEAVVCAAKYRVLALSDSNPLMVRLFEENALWLEGTAARLKHSDNLLKDTPPALKRT